MQNCNKTNICLSSILLRRGRLLFDAKWTIFSSYFTTKLKLNLMGWWRCPLYAGPTRLVGFL